MNLHQRKTYCRSTLLFMKCYMLQEPCMNRVGLTTETNSSHITGAPSPVVGSLITRVLFCPMPDNMTSAQCCSTVYGYALKLFRYNKSYSLCVSHSCSLITTFVEAVFGINQNFMICFTNTSISILFALKSQFNF